jgi:hypothetical protein
MKQDLTDFINSREEGERPLLKKYYKLYLELKANGDEERASYDVLAFFQGITSHPRSELDLEVEHAIDLLENNDHQGYTGGRRKKSKKSKKSRKSRKSRNKRSNKKSRRRRN